MEVPFEGLIFGGAYLRREVCVFIIDWASLIVDFVLPCIWEQFSKYKPPAGLYLEGRFNGGFFALPVWGACIWRGLYMEGLIFGIVPYPRRLTAELDTSTGTKWLDNIDNQSVYGRTDGGRTSRYKKRHEVKQVRNMAGNWEKKEKCFHSK